jgi:hypothetical protein
VGFIIFLLMNPGVHKNEAEVARDRTRLGKNVPAVQSNMRAKTDLYILRNEEDKKLIGQSGQNKDGTYSIPIEAAMQMVVESGAKTPAVEKPVQVNVKPQTGSTEPNPGAASDVVVHPSHNEGHGQGGQP